MPGQPSPLPEPLRNWLLDLGTDLHGGWLDPADLSASLAGLDALPPDTAFAASSHIRSICRLHGILPGIPLSGGAVPGAPRSLADLIQLGEARRERKRQDLLLKLRDEPDLAWLLLFHGDGRWREVALDRIADPPVSAFRFIAIALRLNDWAEQVRAAAVECARRVFPGTSPATIADAAMVLLLRYRQWSRWRGEAEVLDTALARQDVADQLAQRFGQGSTGPLARVLGQALRWDGMDRHLPTLARTAVQPAARAEALRTLIDGRAAWLEGYGQQWTDKTMGQSRRKAVMGGRDVVRQCPVGNLIAFGAADKSTAVRKVAAEALIKHRDQAATMQATIHALAADRSPAVRERIAFIIRAMGQDSVPGS